MNERIAKAVGDLVDVVASEVKVSLVPMVMGAVSEVSKNGSRFYQNFKEAVNEKAQEATKTESNELEENRIKDAMDRAAILNSLTQDELTAIRSLKKIKKKDSEISKIVDVPQDVVELVN